MRNFLHHDLTVGDHTIRFNYHSIETKVAMEQRRPGWLLFLDRANVVMVVVTGYVVLRTRSAGVAYFGAGALVCTLSVGLLKRVIRQPRPLNHTSRQKATYGMPSTHSATTTYYAVYIMLACLGLPRHESFPSSRQFRVVPPIIFTPCAGLIVLSRVWLGHHTWSQVGAGVSYGVFFALVWFNLWRSGLDQYGPLVETMINECLT